jgi:hypothetical protein
MADGIHWYASDKTRALGIDKDAGESVWEVPDAKGNMTQNFDIRHAKKYALCPGVTGVNGMLAKPGLVIWGENNTALGGVYGEDGETVDPTNSLAARLFRGEIDEKAYTYQCRSRKGEIGAKAADRGSEIHDVLEQYIKHGSDKNHPYVKLLVQELSKIRRAAKAAGYKFPARTSFIAEGSFFHPRGFGGRTDLVIPCKSEDPSKPDLLYVCDYKTRDFTEDDVKTAVEKNKEWARRGKPGRPWFGRKLEPRDTEPLQIAANIAGQAGIEGTAHHLGCNIYLSRTQEKRAFTVGYTTDQLATAWETFTCLLTVWQNFKLK